MQAVQSANILAVGTGFSTKTLCIGTVLDRQVFLIENNITIDIGDRNLCRRNQIEVVKVAMVHLSFFIRQLTCAVAGSSIDNCRWHQFGVTALAGFVEEEVDECALQTCALADINGESSTGNLHTQVEVDEVVFLCQFPMGQWGIVCISD